MAQKQQRDRNLAPKRYTEQIVAMLTREDGQTLKRDAAEFGVSQAELVREAILRGYASALAEFRKRSREQTLEAVSR